MICMQRHTQRSFLASNGLAGGYSQGRDPLPRHHTSEERLIHEPRAMYSLVDAQVLPLTLLEDKYKHAANAQGG